MRQAPPTRTSNSQTGLVKPFGPHQRIMCCGSVHSLNTSSRGASKTRVRTISRIGLSGAPGLSLLAAMLLLLCLEFVEIIAEAIEAALPARAAPGDPFVGRLQRRR